MRGQAACRIPVELRESDVARCADGCDIAWRLPFLRHIDEETFFVEVLRISRLGNFSCADWLVPLGVGREEGNCPACYIVCMGQKVARAFGALIFAAGYAAAHEIHGFSAAISCCVALGLDGEHSPALEWSEGLCIDH